jgi:hypothetical protein
LDTTTKQWYNQQKIIMREVPRFPFNLLSGERRGASFREPTDGTSRYQPSGASPAHPYIDKPLQARQRVIESEFQKLFDQPPVGTPPEFARILSEDHMSGEARRKMKNYEGYMEWKALNETVDPDIEQEIYHFERGSANQDEILDIALGTAIPYFEVGKVTHPYAKRLEYVEPFRIATNAAIARHNGVVYPSFTPYRSITIMPKVEYRGDSGHSLHGLIVKYKRDVGHIIMPDNETIIRIIERQLAGYRVDAASGFDQSIVHLMEQTPIGWTHVWQENEQEYLVDTGCRGFVEKAVQLDLLDSYVVPISTTIYGFKEKMTTKEKMYFLGSEAAGTVDHLALEALKTALPDNS